MRDESMTETDRRPGGIIRISFLISFFARKTGTESAQQSIISARRCWKWGFSRHFYILGKEDICSIVSKQAGTRQNVDCCIERRVETGRKARVFGWYETRELS